MRNEVWKINAAKNLFELIKLVLFSKFIYSSNNKQRGCLKSPYFVKLNSVQLLTAFDFQVVKILKLIQDDVS